MSKANITPNLNIDLSKLTKRETALLLTITERTLSTWVDSFGLPVHEKESTRPYYVWEECLDWFKERTKTDTITKMEKSRPAIPDDESIDSIKKAGMRLDNELKQMDVDEKSKLLVRTELVESIYGEAVLNCKTKLMAIPSVVAARLIGLDAQQIQDELADHIQLALNELAISCLQEPSGETEDE